MSSQSTSLPNGRNVHFRSYLLAIAFTAIANCLAPVVSPVWADNPNARFQGSWNDLDPFWHDWGRGDSKDIADHVAAAEKALREFNREKETGFDPKFASSLDEAETKRRKMADLVEREEELAPREPRNTWQGSPPPLPDEGARDSEIEPWRREHLRMINSYLQRAQDLIDELRRSGAEPGAAEYREAMRQIDGLLSVAYREALRMRITELRWRREHGLPPLSLKVEAGTIRLRFVAWENLPGFDEIVERRGGLVGGINWVRDLMSAQGKDPEQLLATMGVNWRPEVWRVGHRSYTVMIQRAASVGPYVPTTMKKRPQLLAEAIRIGRESVAIPLTIDNLESLREQGRLTIPVASTSPLRGLQHWMLTSTRQTVIRIGVEAASGTHAESGTASDNSDAASAGDVADSGSDAGPIESEDNTASDSRPSDQDSDDSDRDGGLVGEPTRDGSPVSPPSSRERRDRDREKHTPGSEDGSRGASTPGKPSRAGDSIKAQPEGSASSPENSQDEAGERRAEDSDPSDPAGPSDEAPSDDVRNENDGEDADILGEPRPDTRPNRNAPTDSRSSHRQRGPRDWPVDGARQGNWLTADAVRGLPTDRVDGLWIGRGGLEWFDLRGGRLTVRDAHNPKSVRIEANRQTSGRFFGAAYTVPRGRNCPGRGFKQPALLVVSRGSAWGSWKGKKVDEATCELSDRPDGGSFQYQRLQAISFAPLAHGRFMHLVGAPAVGPHAARFKATAKIHPRYEGTGASKVVVRMGGQILTSADGGATFDFVTTRSGRHALEAEWVAADGDVRHRQRIRIDVPAIPGVGR